MTTLLKSGSTVTIAGALEELFPHGVPFRFTAYDGSAGGPEDSPVSLHLANERGLSYLLTAPGDLGMARAYVAGDLLLQGAHPGDPYELMKRVIRGNTPRMPSPAQAVRLLRGLGLQHLVPPPPPPQESLPRWRRVVEGVRHSKIRDAEVISHHYDVSNRFYELVLGPSMTYTCACYPTEDATLEEAQAFKYDLVARKLGLRPGMRLLDVGCGWGGMVRHAARHYDVQVLGVTLSKAQATWAQEAIERDGLSELAEVRHLDYRDVAESDFDAVSSIGLTEHIGIRNYPAYFSFLRDKLVPGGRLLNHCITRPDNRPRNTGAFIDRYIFPDGELTGSGRIITEIQDAGLEVRHEENLREHYAMTCRAWARNLAARWDECVAEVGEGTAKAWGIYLAGCSLGFEINDIQLHQVLAVKLHDDGRADFPLRPDWLSLTTAGFPRYAGELPLPTAHTPWGGEVRRGESRRSWWDDQGVTSETTGFRSGFACFVGRPNAGKSTLTNALVGTKVAITSSKPQTTRTVVRGIVHRADGQLILVDTPGLHRPRTLLGERLNDLVTSTWSEVDVVGVCFPADQKIGPGDRFLVTETAKVKNTTKFAVATKTDLVGPERVGQHLLDIAALGVETDTDWAEIVPVSAVNGDQVGLLADLLLARLPEGPPLYPEGEITDAPEEAIVADLIREAALEGVRDELPHSIAVVVEEMGLRPDRPAERPLLDVHANLFVERSSQKGIVIGHQGARLREVGTTARKSIEAMLGTPVYLDLRVKIAKDWQRDPRQLRRLGF